MNAFPVLRIEGAGQDILFLHGWSAHGGFFAPQAPLATSGFRLLQPDLPGHGARASRNPHLTIAMLADSLAQWLESADPARKVLLVGWSMGAFVALDYLARHGATRVAGLAIIDMTPMVANDAQWTIGLASGQRAADMIAQAEEMAANWQGFVPRIARAMFARGMPPDPAALAEAQAAMAANDGATMAALWRDLARADFRDTLDKAGIPRLAMLGARSCIYGTELGNWYRARGMAVEVFDSSGHAPHIEEAALFNVRLAAFARQCF